VNPDAVNAGGSPAAPAVGVIGLGAMGGPIAGHLLEAGFRVAVLDHDESVVERYTARGAVRSGTAAALAGECAVVLVVVPGDDDALAVCGGPEGVLAGAAPGGVVLLCSSLRPETCRRIATDAPPGVGVLDAALTGGVRGAVAGRVNLLVGGDAEVLARARPALAPWCGSVHLLGNLGAGQVGKTVNNLVHWVQISGITEALRLGAAYGLDVSALRRALHDAPTDSRTLRELEQMQLRWHVKDLANAAAMAATVDVALPMADTAREAMVRTTVDSVARLLGTAADPDRLDHAAKWSDHYKE
jgi:3-hydroxyisobutyrate dehydrogenase-like beta-hydroxyacid dehydrogenase